jgi:heme/copper-type cytochrome/quinol oxidase subunit 3
MSAVTHSDENPAYARQPPGDLAIWIFILAELGVFALFFAAYAFARSHKWRCSMNSSSIWTGVRRLWRWPVTLWLVIPGGLISAAFIISY